MHRPSSLPAAISPYLTLTLLTLTDPRSLILNPNFSPFLHGNYAVRNRK